MKRRDLKALWNSNGVWTQSGYGVESRDVLFRLAKDGWNIGQIAFWGLDGYPITLHGEDFNEKFKDVKLRIFPKMGDMYGGDAMVEHSREYGVNAVFTMQDVWVLDPQYLQRLKTWIPYVPIDKDPVPANVLDRLKYAYKIITFSKFGQKTLEKAGFSSTLILEGTDVNIFKPQNREECRTEYGLPQDAFFFGMVAANKENPPRKGFQEALEAFKLFHDKHPEAALFLHTQQVAPSGFPIQQFAQHLGIANRLFFLNQYAATFKMGSYDVARQMNACNALLHPSQTEGFGLTVVEAQSCGIPAIVNNCHSMPELIIPGKTGHIAETDKPRFTNDLSYVYPANVQSLYEKMEETYKMVKENEKQVAKDCRMNVIENYNIDDIVKKNWIPLLEELQEELIPLTTQNQSATINTAK